MEYNKLLEKLTLVENLLTQIKSELQEAKLPTLDDQFKNIVASLPVYVLKLPKKNKDKAVELINKIINNDLNKNLEFDDKVTHIVIKKNKSLKFVKNIYYNDTGRKKYYVRVDRKIPKKIEVLLKEIIEF